jgi:acyl carrier protein
MKREEILEKVIKITSENLCVEESKVKEESLIQEELGADSLDIVELVMAIEEDFEMEITDEEAEKMSTVKEIVDYIVENHPK